MKSTQNLESLVNLYLKQTYTLYKPQNEFGEEITQKITFISRADFQSSLLKLLSLTTLIRASNNI